MKLPVAVQLYSVRDEMQDDFYGTIKKMKEYGYDGVEFAGLFGEEPAKIREFCNEIGIVPISAHVPYYDMLADPEKVLADYAEIGCKYVAVPYLTEECRPGTDGFTATVEASARLPKPQRSSAFSSSIITTILNSLSSTANTPSTCSIRPSPPTCFRPR